MAQLFKRTKKSCIKFFRKLTSSAKPSVAKIEEDPEGAHPIRKCLRNDMEDSHHREIPMSSPYIISSKIANNRNKNKINSQTRSYRSFQCEPSKSTNFIVSSNYSNKLNTYIANARQTINPKIWSCDFPAVRRFRLLSEEDAVNVREELSDRGYSTEVIFEKVKYRDNIRYFRRSPSNSSLSSHLSTPKAVQTHKEYNCLQNEEKTEYNCTRTYSQNRQSNIYLQFRNNISHPVNLTLTSDMSGNFNNLVISEGRNWLNEPCPIVTWDINGNSIDDDIICLNNNWDDCDNRLNTLRDKRLMKTRSDGSHKSSSRSSSTTLETWVDDEILENSFNEEIEKQFCI